MSTSITYLPQLVLHSFPVNPSLLSSTSLLCCDPCCPICLAASLHRCMQLTFALSALPARSHTHTHKYYLRRRESVGVCVYICACVYILHALFKRTARWAWTWASSPNCRLVCCLLAHRSLFGLTGDSLPLAGFTSTQREGGMKRGHSCTYVRVEFCSQLEFYLAA